MVGSRDDPLFVRWVPLACTQKIRACVYTGDPAAARWAVVGNIDCVTDADKMLRATDEVFRYVMYALYKGCGGDHYTGITATDPGDVRSVRVTLPDGNAGNLQPVLCDILESGVDQGLHRPVVHAMPSGQARGVFARGARENAVRALAHRRVVRV